MAHRGRRFATGLVAALAVASAVVPLSPASATKDFKFTRFAGQNRYDTARLIAAGSGFGVVQNVVVATGENFPDALAGNYLAAALGSPILLTQQNSLPAETNTALVGVQAKSVTLLGGTSAISSAVETDLKGRGYDVRRIAGANRYDTAAAAARQAALTSAVGSVANKKTAFVATGENFADALAAGPVSYAGKLPILLTTPNTLSAQTKQAIQDLKVEQVLVLGGTSAVSQAVEAELKATPGVTGVARIVGADRTQTATSIAQFGIEFLQFDQTHINLARGDQFADALAGGPHGGRELSGTLLAASSSALDAGSGANSTFLKAYAAKLEDGHIFGGASAVSGAVEAAAMAAAGAAPPEAPAGTYDSLRVREVAYADDYFISADGLRFQYDSGDTYEFNGSATSMTAVLFEAMLNPDDVIDVEYATSGKSTFNITNDVVHRAPTPTMKYKTADTVEVTAFIPQDNSPGTTYTVQLIRVVPGCGGEPSESAGNVPVATFPQPAAGTSETVTFTSGPFGASQTHQPGCWAPRVKASSPAPSTARDLPSSAGNQLQLPSPTPPDTTDPKIDKATLTDVATTGTVSKGDVHVFEFNEVMAASIVANGSGYRLVDGDNTTVEIFCGQNATCAKDDNNPQTDPPFRFSKVTVTLTAAPTAKGGSIAGFAYTSVGKVSQLGAMFGWADSAGNPVNLSASDDYFLP